MPSEFTKNLPHIIAIAILIFALLVVSTKAGLVRCSSLGNQFCQVMDSIFGRPKIAIVYGDEGIGDPFLMKKTIEGLWKIPVDMINIDDLSPGMLDNFNLVIVEKSRTIPSSKLKIFYDYIMRKVDGRLVWIGDSGTFGGPDDQDCRDMKFLVSYKEKESNSTRLKSAPHVVHICVKESELNLENTTLFQSSINRQEAVSKEAWDELAKECSDFGGSLQPVQETLGYRCELPSDSDYSEMFFVWENEDDFKRIINPWDRGNYSSVSGDDLPGFNFGSDVLGISFIADDFAVKNYQNYQEDLSAIREKLADAHSGLVDCSRLKSSGGCSVSAEQSKARSDLRKLTALKDNLRSYLDGMITTLDSISTQKQLKNDTSGALLLTDAVNKLSNERSSIADVAIPSDVPTAAELQDMKGIPSAINRMIGYIAVLKGSETDGVIKQQYDGMENQLNQSMSNFNATLSLLETDTRSYIMCKATGSNTVKGALVSAVGSDYSSEISLLLSYASPMTDENGVLSIMSQATDKNGLRPKWRELRDKLANLDESTVCDRKSTEAKLAFTDIVSALDEMDTAARRTVVYDAIPTLVVSDVDHLLVRGISRATELKITGEDVPISFILVGTNPDARVVAKLRVTPIFAGRQYWPAISEREPKFGTHAFSKGTVIYYAFPPEIEEQLVNNMVEFLLY
ncbi:MAG: hypothetical protein J7L23_00965 [Candidatus Diapherotrites archaeon]|nr:hypothetical protein [Candidatus Diapherotrites archaeon]